MCTRFPGMGEGGGGVRVTHQNFIRGGAAPGPTPYLFIYHQFYYEKGTPFVCLLLTNGTPFTYLV